MLLLAVETSSVRGSLALFQDGECREEAAFPEGFSYGREVPLRVDRLLRDHGASPRDLDGVAVSVGPGSYTGTRVGVTAAKTLAWALDVPVLGIESLRVLAASVCLAAEEGREIGQGPSALVATVLDGRQDFLYGALWEVDLPETGGALPVDLGGAVRAIVPQCVDDTSGIRATLHARAETGASGAGVIVVGDGADRFLDAPLASDGSGAVESGSWTRLPARADDPWGPDVPRARALGRLAIGSIRSMGPDREAAHRLEPLYLRATEAERKLMGGGR